MTEPTHFDTGAREWDQRPTSLQLAAVPPRLLAQVPFAATDRVLDFGAGTGLLATAIAVTNGTLIEQHVAQVNRVPTGNRGQTSAPVDVFEVTDGFILLAVTGNPLYRRWAKLMLADPATAQPDDIGWKLSGDGIMKMFGTEDFSEGLTAFAEKRPPQWKGR